MDSRDAVLELILELLAEDEFRAGPSAGHGAAGLPARLARQALDTILDWLGRVERAHPLTVRLVKGAYWDHEIVAGAPARLARAGVRRQGRLRPQLRGADPPAARRAGRPCAWRSPPTTCARSATRSPTTGCPAATTRDLELQVLRGLGDPLQTAIARQGLRVRTYCPVGDLVAGMAYLVRRLLENTSNDSLPGRAGQGRRARRAAGASRRGRRRRRMKPFANEPILELRRAPVRASSPTRSTPTTPSGPLKVPVWIGDDTPRGRGHRLHRSRQPRPRGRRGGRRDARARSTRRSPRRAPLGRARGGARGALAPRPRSGCASGGCELAALAVRECAKPWPEADADVCEAIDFLEYYARGAIDLAQGAPLLQPPGERNELRWDAARRSSP